MNKAVKCLFIVLIGYKIWWALTGSNRRHSACKADALPTELSALRNKNSETIFMIQEKYIIYFLTLSKISLNNLLSIFKNQDFKKMAQRTGQRTGLEPATLGVTGRYSNQLNYRCIYTMSLLWYKRIKI